MNGRNSLVTVELNTTVCSYTVTETLHSVQSARLPQLGVTNNGHAVAIVGDMNQHLVSGAFNELTVVHGLKKHVTSTHVREGFPDPVLNDLHEALVHCRRLDRICSSE